MHIDIPTPPNGSEVITARRVRHGSAITFGVPLTVIGTGVVVALGWAWNIDKSQALDHQRLDEHEHFKDEVKSDLRRFEGKLDDMRDLLVHRNSSP